jgi:hypothetical protein
MPAPGADAARMGRSVYSPYSLGYPRMNSPALTVLDGGPDLERPSTMGWEMPSTKPNGSRSPWSEVPRRRSSSIPAPARLADSEA